MDLVEIAKGKPLIDRAAKKVLVSAKLRGRGRRLSMGSADQRYTKQGRTITRTVRRPATPVPTPAPVRPAPASLSTQQQLEHVRGMNANLGRKLVESRGSTRDTQKRLTDTVVDRDFVGRTLDEQNRRLVDARKTVNATRPPVKRRVVRTRRPAAKPSAPAPDASLGRENASLAADRAKRLEQRMQEKEGRLAEKARGDRYRNISAATGAAGGTAAVAGGAVAARRAMRLRHMPAPGGMNNTQRALVGAGAGASAGMLLHERSTRR